MRLVYWGVLLTLAILVVLTHGNGALSAEDDAYIHFRIAENLLNHGLPYFNVSEAVMSSSSPGWTLFLAAISYGRDSINIQMISYVNALITIVCIVLGIKIIERHTGRAINHIQLAIGVACLFVVLNASSVGLMETPLAVFFLFAGTLLLQHGKYYGFVLLAFATVVRPELIVFATVFFIFYPGTKREYLKAAVWGLAGGLPFLVYDIYYFSTIIPHTAKAKALVHQVSMIGSAAGIVRPIPYVGRVVNYLFTLAAVIVAIRLVYTTAIKGDFRKKIWDMSPVHLLAVSALLLGALYVLKKTYIFMWYAPLVLSPMLVAGFSLWSADLFGTKTRKFLYFYLGIHIVALVQVVTGVIMPGEGIGSGSARVQKYLLLSKRLYEKYPEYRLMTSEIGGIGYGFRGMIIDGVGLISPTALKHHPLKVPEERSYKSAGAIPASYVEEQMPEIIVSYTVGIEQFLRSEIRKQYNTYEEPPYPRAFVVNDINPMWGGNPLYVFIRKDVDRGWKTGD